MRMFKLLEAVQAEAAPGSGPVETGKKKEREAVKVQMQDGREVEFVGKQQMLKDALVGGVPIEDVSAESLANAEVGDLAIRLDFRNGATRTYPLNPQLFVRWALHGGLQKYGDHLSGGVKNEDGTVSNDLDDWAEATDQLHEQLSKGDWSKGRVGGGGGDAVLITALMEISGQNRDQVRAFIKDWDPKTRASMMQDPEVKPIVDRIKAEKASKHNVDTGSLKDKLRALGSAAA